jgi:hypothetical protein
MEDKVMSLCCCSRESILRQKHDGRDGSDGSRSALDRLMMEHSSTQETYIKSEDDLLHLSGRADLAIREEIPEQLPQPKEITQWCNRVLGTAGTNPRVTVSSDFKEESILTKQLISRSMESEVHSEVPNNGRASLPQVRFGVPSQVASTDRARQVINSGVIRGTATRSTNLPNYDVGDTFGGPSANTSSKEEVSSTSYNRSLGNALKPFAGQLAPVFDTISGDRNGRNFAVTKTSDKAALSAPPAAALINVPCSVISEPSRLLVGKRKLLEVDEDEEW